ncbi:hypothetical protein [Inediibacterium massiliense]|uniref:hypothetical protein n=1 Tax=Inediibacterium massiliense TaxID=1658111 RepID=UPI0006B424F3|nr:hypothetical protein [Inediibacterium massiliense]
MSNKYGIKRLADQIERALELGNKVHLERLVHEMMQTCNHIKIELQEKKKNFHAIQLEEINRIPFVYKPILKKNYYEGTYLEEFSERRTMELKDAKALDLHNKFWKTYEVLRGNVFGSMPLELIPKEEAQRLKYFGWDEVNVKILEVKERNCSMKDFSDYCTMHFEHFLIVNEKSTGAELILYYQV